MDTYANAVYYEASTLSAQLQTSCVTCPAGSATQKRAGGVVDEGTLCEPRPGKELQDLNGLGSARVVMEGGHRRRSTGSDRVPRMT